MEDHQHLSRHKYHRDIGLQLAEEPDGHPWACVVVFYAAYHSARWGLQRDRRFDDLARLKAVNPHFTPDLRSTEKHRARANDRRAGRDFGVNDLVTALYPHASSAYEKLHQASIEVRYNRGDARSLPPAARLQELVDTVHREIAATVMEGQSER